MIKTIVGIALLFIAVALVQAGPGGRGGGGPGRGPGGSGHGFGGPGPWPSQVCANSSLAPTYLTQLQSVASTLQANGTFTQYLSNHAREIEYIQNATNAALISSNCTGFFAGLQAAKNADRQVNKAQEQAARYLYCQAVQSVYGGPGCPYDDDD